MARLGYSVITSLDGYIEDAAGSFAWAEPDEEVHRFFNDLERSVGVHLYGRRMYETMVFWEDPENVAGGPDYALDYGNIWRAAQKVVFSRSIEAVSSERTRIVREFDPEEVRRWKASGAREHSATDLSIGGAELAGHAFGAGLVDDVHVVIAPVLVGGGKPAFPENTTQKLELVDERHFASGFVYLGYRLKN